MNKTKVTWKLLIMAAIILQTTTANRNVTQYVDTARKIGTAIINKLSEEMSYRSHRGMARRFSSYQTETIIYDAIWAIALPLGLIASGYSAYVILRSVLSPLFMGLDLTMVLPPGMSVVPGIGTGIPVIGRRKRWAKEANYSSEELFDILRTVENAMEKFS